MPGDYGPAGKWIHDRAHGIMEDGDTPKHVAYAIATQQAHKVGKSPKDFRTPHGVHEAKQKYDEPKSEYQKTAGGGELAIHTVPVPGVGKMGVIMPVGKTAPKGWHADTDKIIAEFDRDKNHELRRHGYTHLIKSAGREKQRNMAELAVEAIRSGMDRAKALKLLAKGKLDVLRQSAPKATALQAFESTLGKTSSVARLEGFFDELEKIAGPAFEAALQAGGGKMTDAAHAAGHSEWLKQQAAKANLGTILKRHGRVGGSAAKPVAGGLLSGVKRLFGRN